MMRRAAIHAQLDAAAAESRVTVICGLPCVGRSTLLREWSARHPEARICQDLSELNGGGGLLIFDHVDTVHADHFIAGFRNLETKESPTRLFVAPLDLEAVAKIRLALAGKARLIEVAPLQPFEVAKTTQVLLHAAGPDLNASITPVSNNVAPIGPDRHWLRGGFPESLFADSDAGSQRWRRDMMKTLLERDYTHWQVPQSYRIQDALRYLANRNSDEFDSNVSGIGKLAEFKSAVHVLEKLGLVRRLFNFPAGSNESLTRKPKLYVRDTGILHAMLDIETAELLRADKDVGASFESYAIEALILAAGEGCSAQFYRAESSNGADEIDLILNFPAQNNRIVAIECKTKAGRPPESGFFHGCEVVKASEKFVVHAGQTPDLNGQVHRLDLNSAIKRVATIASGLE